MDRPRPTSVLAVAVAAAVAAAAVASGVAGAADPAPVPVDSCTTIDDPGTYVLTGDLSAQGGGDCLVVTAAGVTVEGRNYRIDAGGGDVGVRVLAGDVTVRNLSVADGRRGVDADAGAGTIALVGVTVAGTDGPGVVVESGADVAIADVWTRSTGDDGIVLDAGGSLSVDGAVATDAGGYGLFAQSDDGPLSFADVRVEDSVQEGFEVLGGGNVTVDGLTVTGVLGDEFPEPYDGAFVDVDGSVVLSDVTVADVDEGRGIYVYAATDDGTVRAEGVVVRRTRDAGVVLGSQGETALSVSNATVADAGGAGLSTSGFGSVALDGLDVRGPADPGVRIGGSPATVEDVSVADTPTTTRDLVLAGADATLADVSLAGTELGGTARNVALDAPPVSVPDGYATLAGPVTVTSTAPDGRFDAEVGYGGGNGSGIDLYRMSGSGWAPVANSTVDADRGVVAAPLTTNGTFAVLVERSSRLAPYANAAGVVDDAGLAEAIDDWVDGRIDDGLLARAIDAWVSGEPVGPTG
jgi:hypothetical protein